MADKILEIETRPICEETFRLENRFKGRTQPIDHSRMPVIVVHGGASKKPANKIEIIMKEVKNACKAGHNILKAKGSALNAAVEAVKVMEDHPYFNAGNVNPIY